MPALPSLIGAGTSLLGGLLGSSASSRAAKLLNQTGTAVAGDINKSTGQAIDAGYKGMGEANTAVDTGTAGANKYIGDAGTAQKDIYGNETGAIQPYQAAGTVGLNRLQSASPFSFNPSDLQNDPGYQFQLQQGMKALQSSAAGRGMLQSGATLKSTENYAQGLAGTSYQNAYNRALTTFNANQQQNQTLANMGMTANNQFLNAGSTYGGQLTSLAGLGSNVDMTGAGMKSNVATQGNQYIGNIGLKGSEDAGNVRMEGAGAQAGGTLGSANAWSNAFGGAGSNVMYGLSKMKGFGGSGSWGGGGGGGTPDYSADVNDTNGGG